jgi:hypothetical protein
VAVRHPKIAPIIAEAEARSEAGIERAVEKYAVSRERNIAELARMAYANMADYTRKTPGGELVADFSEADRDALVAVQEIVVEDFVDGRGEDARDVRRVRFKLASKQGAIEQLNRMMGWIVDKSEVGKPGDFSHLTDEQLDQEIAKQLVAMGLSERQLRLLRRAGWNARSTNSRPRGAAVRGMCAPGEGRWPP